MIEVSKCVICEGAIVQLKRPGRSLLAERIWNRTPFCVGLVQCESCGFMFYNRVSTTTSFIVFTITTALGISADAPRLRSLVQR